MDSVYPLYYRATPLPIHGLRPDTIMAILVGTIGGFGQFILHHVGGDQWRIQVDRSGRSGAPMGRTQIQAQHELWQAESGAALLLRQEHHDQGARQTIRVQVRFPGAGPGHRARARSGLIQGVSIRRFVWHALVGRLSSSNFTVESSSSLDESSQLSLQAQFCRPWGHQFRHGGHCVEHVPVGRRGGQFILDQHRGSGGESLFEHCRQCGTSRQSDGAPSQQCRPCHISH